MLIRDQADASPTTCVICNGTNTPILDTATDVPGYGRINMCIGTIDNPGCLLQALRESYGADPALKGQLETQIQDYAREVGILRERATLADQLIELVMSTGLLVQPTPAETPPVDQPDWQAPEPEAEPELELPAPEEPTLEFTREQLLERADELEIKGRHQMNKAELVDAIADAEQEE